jgi:SAM-dependent methyltransferase
MLGAEFKRMRRRVRRWFSRQPPAESAPGSAQPHFLRDYRSLAALLQRTEGVAGLKRGVGSNFTATGKIELACLKHFGLKAGDSVLDVGCGSGRLTLAISKVPGIRYHGIDVAPEFLAHARSLAPPHFRFTLVDGLTIPDADSTADIVIFYSVATHLFLYETYVYLQEAVRVAKPGGRILMSFHELKDSRHWQVFLGTIEDMQLRRLPHHNAFLERSVVRVWAQHLGLTVEAILPGGEAQIPIDEPIDYEDGRRAEGTATLGQSLAVLRKP